MADIYFAWKLPDDATQHVSAHSILSSICTRDVLPRRLTADEDAQIAELCRHPVVRLNKSVATLMLGKVFAVKPQRSSDKHQRLADLIDNEEATAELSDFISAGYDIADMRYMNGKQADGAFQPFMSVLAEMLEKRSQLAAEERRRADGANDNAQPHGVTVRPTPLAASMRALHVACETELRCKPETTDKLASREWKVPSLSAFCDRMSPAYPARLASSRLNGMAGIIMKIQCRTLRKLSLDATTCKACCCAST